MVRSTKTIPESPGVYLMKDSEGEVLYVGKAKNLRKRVSSYFSASKDSREHISHLIKKVTDIETISVSNETEAILLENNLIKKHSPRYNILLKDDKTFFYLFINHEHPWPRINLVRAHSLPKKTKHHSLFGPYVNSEACKALLETVCNFFPLRTCSDKEFSNRKRPCVLYDMKKCVAPCVGYSSQGEYQLLIKEALLFLSGKKTQVIKLLEEKLQSLSETLEFEKAAVVYRTLNLIKKSLSNQNVERHINVDSDVIGFFKHTKTVVTLLSFRSGKLLDARHFYFQENAQEDVDLLTSFLLQYYENSPQLPQEILVPIPLPSVLSKILQKNSSVKILCPLRGYKKSMIALALQNAEEYFESKEAESPIHLQLQELLQLSNLPKRIECYDNAHTSGSAAVGGFIVWKDDRFIKQDYRAFLINTEAQSNDHFLLEKALRKRFCSSKPIKIPDLIIVDGGKGHFATAKRVLDDLNLNNIDLLSISKEKSNHSKGLLNERIFGLHFPKGLSLPTTSPLLHFIQRIRDEAHRFILSFHRRRRAKSTLQSQIKIPGIGPIKMTKLLRRFKSPAAILSATPEELLLVPGITRKDVFNITKYSKENS
ncbi:excinuclease ABC subunit UvrC [Chlamydiifrater phoenicopteri]|uniref:excinuclease ABC subunit UvrC n=1 Tax=Chlamydiifrater phoenicopteri TaxID=2681469 RepID=UPI001BCFB4DA|nr:excinuclease ABC subunit UvrC [Chlamydiifrater phoenicopteri]